MNERPWDCVIYSARRTNIQVEREGTHALFVYSVRRYSPLMCTYHKPSNELDFFTGPAGPIERRDTQRGTCFTEWWFFLEKEQFAQGSFSCVQIAPGEVRQRSSGLSMLGIF